MMATIFVAALCFTACDRENGGGGGSHTPEIIQNAVQDVDGNQYDAVRIGNQVWMAENLKTTHYKDGTEIPLVVKIEGFDVDYSKTQPYRYCPNNAETNVDNYGYLYNWPAVMHGAESSDANPSGVQGICPDGWHVPSRAEWEQLRTYMSSEPMYRTSDYPAPDGIAKALAATWGWESSSWAGTPGNDPSSNNVSGFSALPAGACTWDATVFGSFNSFGFSADFWSSTISSWGVDYFNLQHAYSITYISSSNKDLAFSIRCVQD